MKCGLDRVQCQNYLKWTELPPKRVIRGTSPPTAPSPAISSFFHGKNTALRVRVLRAKI